MQYILSEEEYKKLTPKEGITTLVDEFLKDLSKAFEPVELYGQRLLTVNRESFKKAYGDLENRMEYKLQTLTLTEEE